ncbi:MAG: DUF1810 family protein [Erysipelotrichaceae bacterium]|nr:DUF1810 family protein [Erysipelotrichaceae bacterium]
MDEKENAKIKGDGQPYVEMAIEEYNNLTEEERKEVDEIGKKINTIFGINDDDFVRSSIYGFVVGDALGVPVEFLSRETLKNNPIQDMEEYGTHNQPKGTWSDDTSMVLATIDGILNSRIPNIDYKKIITNFLNWKQKGEFTPFGKVFDIGNSTSYALSIYQQHIYDNNPDDVICGTGNINSNGNGSLMRILPISLYLYYLGINYEDNKFFEIIKIISSMTHSHLYSILGCYIYTIYVIEILKVHDKNIAYKNMQNILQNICNKNDALIDIKNIYGRIVYEDISKLEEKDIKSSGYVVDSLEATIWTILTTNSFEESVLKAVNLGEDTDTIGALTGSLAGIIYGYNSISQKWINTLQWREYLDKIINQFVEYLNKLTTNATFQQEINLVKKYDSYLFNYYFEENNDYLKLIRLDNGKEITLDKQDNEKLFSRIKLAFSCFDDHDLTAFSAYIREPLTFFDKDANKRYCFLSEERFHDIYLDFIDEKIKNEINIDISNFYSDKQLQLKFNFVILHPICFEIDKDNLDGVYRSLSSIDDDLIYKFLNHGIDRDFISLNYLLKEIKTLKKFIDIQNENYERALSEIKSGKKLSHWMWYIFPQIKGLGHSDISNYYAINNLEEAKLYLENDLLRSRLINILNELLNLNTNDAIKIFGKIDALKLCSSITLFYLVDPTIKQFELIIKKFFDGNFDGKTIDIIHSMKKKDSVKSFMEN